jgi:hypothetical protein
MGEAARPLLKLWPVTGAGEPERDMKGLKAEETRSVLPSS